MLERSLYIYIDCGVPASLAQELKDTGKTHHIQFNITLLKPSLNVLTYGRALRI